jgi:3',5'-cyclic AMP phosphodiesterase CpdA
MTQRRACRDMVEELGLACSTVSRGKQFGKASVPVLKPRLCQSRLYLLTLVIVAATFSACFPKGSNGAERARLTFVQWNDAHVEVATPPWFRLANEKADYLVQFLNAGTTFGVPDFVIGVGDMVNGRNDEDLSRDFALLQTKLALLKCPFYPVMGNHEDRELEGDAKHQASYRAAFGNDRVNYAFCKGGIQFIVLDNSGAPTSNNKPIGQARRDWLRQTLRVSPDVPIVLCMHVPLALVREESVLAKSYGFPDKGYIAHDDQMLKIVKEHRHRIVAVLSGHLHMSGATIFDGIYQIVVSGTADCPCDYACYQVFHDRIHVDIRSLPDSLLTPDTNTDGKPRHPIDYTDATHPTARSFVAGNASERSFDIMFKTPLPQASE